MLEQAYQQAKAWSALCADVVIAINVSPVQFERDDVPNMVARTLRRANVDPHHIELEITESTLMAHAVLPALRELNVSIAIDDFGTGYSSLGYVRSFMADWVKLDMSFVRGRHRLLARRRGDRQGRDRDGAGTGYPCRR